MAGNHSALVAVYGECQRCSRADYLPWSYVSVV